MPANPVIVGLLEQGVDISVKGYHLYKSVGSKEYTILHFDHKGNLIQPDEESFPDVGDAISKFCQRTNIDI